MIPLRSSRLLLVLAGAGMTALLLGGCVESSQPPPIPEMSSPTGSPTPTPMPTVDPTAVPQSRFGLDCDSVLTGTEFETLFGSELTVQSQHFRDLAAMQDGDFDCVWDNRSDDGSLAAVWVGAAPYGRAALDERVTAFTPSLGGVSPIAMSGVGDAAWASCESSPRSEDDNLVRCSWVVAVNQTWIWVALVDLPDSEVTFTPRDAGRTLAEPREATASAALVGSIAETFRQAVPAQVRASEIRVAECDALVDWVGLAQEFGLGAPSSSTIDPYLASVGDYIRHSAGELASENQGARHCSRPFDSGVFMLVDVIPRAAWVEKIGQWKGWSTTTCSLYEGTSCELSGYSHDLAIHVRFTGQTPIDGFLESAFAQIAAGSTP